MPNLNTNVSWSDFKTESVVITRRSSTAVNGAFPESTIYSGACDFQSEKGAPFYNPQGAVEVSDAILFLDTAVNAQVADKATVTQNGVSTEYTVVNVSLYTFPLTSTEITLKRGPLAYKNGR